jgi:hypothetical protein
MLSGVSDGDDLPGAPTFDETRHANICAEVRRLWLKPSFLCPFMLSWLAVEIIVRCNYPGSKQALDCGKFRVIRANEGA